ncbi:MAG: hypothetical protein JST46_12370 [Bacteroidetes bacterium]|nr:hypothetical protein [Bacteroidota bacterium]
MKTIVSLHAASVLQRTGSVMRATLFSMLRKKWHSGIPYGANLWKF